MAESHFDEIAVFKDVNNKWRTKSLYIELTEAGDKYPAFFTLAEDDRKVDGSHYLSVKRKYLEYADPTEHIFATSIFGSYECWESQLNSPTIRPYIDQWRRELDLLLKAKGIKKLKDAMEEGDVAAAKWFAESKFKGEDKSHPRNRGRPSKEEVARETKRMASESLSHKEAAERLGIKLV